MSNCILCSKKGEERKYFFTEQSLCDEHCIGYYKYLIEGFKDEVTTESASSALGKCKIELKPTAAPIKPMPKPKPTPYRSNPFKMGM
ncbi:hypothetical protein ACLHDG_14315 [Sulfurovum sp. CS9]|uniref:hypothetical protein n=1 Tax=Sulfurovum sp. CS9 TaxID=3391146 RepID=UPI0039E96239